MNRAFFELFLQREEFPQAACRELRQLALENEAQLDRLLAFYNRELDHAAAEPLVADLAEACGCSRYSIWMVLLILAAEQARRAFPTEELFWQTYQDLRYKLLECHRCYGVWGTFVPFWYPRFSRGDILQLGRLQYEVRRDAIAEPMSAFGMEVKPGEPLLFIHIPSGAGAFDREARRKSYKLAYDHFCGGEGKLVCVCDSWLLYPGYEELFTGNIADFRKEFAILGERTAESFKELWRVFDIREAVPAETLPEQTSLQRAFKAHMLRGGSFGSGTGLLVFDGQQLLTKRP